MKEFKSHPRPDLIWRILESTAPGNTELSQPDSPEMLKGADDDYSIENKPTRHVDYLSHDWTEEDIWSSWKYIVARRGVHDNSVRLENALWRTGIKLRHHLRTVSPVTLNWLKDCDVTWLYGPLQTASKDRSFSTSTPPPSRLSKSGSSLIKKPIFKKRSASEAVLQQSWSAHTRLKHVGANAQVLEADKSQEGERRQIHFNNEVSQCIALEGKGGDGEGYTVFDDSVSNSEEDLVVEDIPHGPWTSNQNTLCASLSDDGKIIALLPSTTLRGDTPEPAEQSATQVAVSRSSESKLSSSLLQEILYPSTPPTIFILDGEEADLEWQPPRSSSGEKDCSSITRDDQIWSNSDAYKPGPGMRRIASEMFLPFEEGEDDVAAAGLIGRLKDNVNTVRDIAYVIWYVGW